MRQAGIGLWPYSTCRSSFRLRAGDWRVRVAAGGCSGGLCCREGDLRPDGRRDARRGIERTADGEAAALQDVGVDHGGLVLIPGASPNRVRTAWLLVLACRVRQARGRVDAPSPFDDEPDRLLAKTCSSCIANADTPDSASGGWSMTRRIVRKAALALSCFPFRHTRVEKYALANRPQCPVWSDDIWLATGGD